MVQQHLHFNFTATKTLMADRQKKTDKGRERSAWSARWTQAEERLGELGVKLKIKTKASKESMSKINKIGKNKMVDGDL